MKKPMPTKGLETLAAKPEDQAPAENTALNDEEELDVNLLTAMGKKMLNEQGHQVLQTGLSQTQDPARVVGTFVSQMAMGMMQRLPPDLHVSPRAYLAEGGFVDRLLDEVVATHGLPEEIKGAAFNTAVETMKAAAQSGQKGEQQGGQPPQAGGPPLSSGSPGPIPARQQF